MASFDYVELFTTGFEALAQEAPRSLPLLHPSVYPDSLAPLWRAFRGPRLVAEELFETRGTVPVIGMLHHENHAAFSWSTSPFALLDLPTLIFVTDANGDDTSASKGRCLFGCRGSHIARRTSSPSHTQQPIRKTTLIRYRSRLPEVEMSMCIHQAWQQQGIHFRLLVSERKRDRAPSRHSPAGWSQPTAVPVESPSKDEPKARSSAQKPAFRKLNVNESTATLRNEIGGT